MKRGLALAITVVLMAALVGLSLRRDSLVVPPRPSADAARTGNAGGTGKIGQGIQDPAQTRVRDLMNAAAAGRVDAYLDAFSGDLKQRLQREVAEKGRDAFASSLRQAASLRKGRALFAPQSDGPDRTRVAVESVYPDRNERHVYTLQRTGSDWFVTDVAVTRTLLPLTRFGEPATFEGPEGVPVPKAAPTPQP